MGVINRECDVSERRHELSVKIAGTVTGSSVALIAVPYNCKVVGAYQAARGLSGSPTHFLIADRFIVGSGATQIGGWAATLAVTAFGTSGAQGFSCPGSSFITLNAGDLLSLYPTGTNAAVAEVTVTLVLECIDDIKKTFSVPVV